VFFDEADHWRNGRSSAAGAKRAGAFFRISPPLPELTILALEFLDPGLPGAARQGLARRRPAGPDAPGRAGCRASSLVDVVPANPVS